MKNKLGGYLSKVLSALGQKDKLNSYLIGIDLGTTNTVVAIYNVDGSISTIQIDGYALTPSVVSYQDDGKILVGESAERCLVTHPKKTIAYAKRFIGTVFEERRNEAIAAHYDVVEGPEGLTRFNINGRLVSPEEVASEILKVAKKAAEKELGHEVSKCVITVPARFNENQRKATRDAATIAGLEAVKIINEPTAAALAYATKIKSESNTIAVYDLGGGTFDFTVLRINDDELEVLGSSGNNHLGGENFNEMLVTMACAKFMADHGISLADGGHHEAMARLRTSAEKVKIELSAKENSHFNLPFLTVGSDGPKHLDLHVTRDQFEAVINEMVDSTISTMEELIKEIGLSKSDIDEVIMVGGSTMVPLVSRKVSEFVGKDLEPENNAFQVVAHGAAIQAAIHDGNAPVKLKDITSLDLGIRVKGDKMSTIISRNTKIPFSATKEYTTDQDNTTKIRLNILQGNSEIASSNKTLSEITFELPPMKAFEAAIYVTFAFDDNGILEVTAKDATGKKVKKTLDQSGNLRESELEKIEAEHALPVEHREKINEARAKVGNALEAAKDKVLALPAAEAQLVEAKIAKAEDVINNSVEISDLVEVAGDIIEVIPE